MGRLIHIPRRSLAIPVASLSFIASTTSTASTVTAPASIDAGDLLVILEGAGGSVSGSLASGFTLAREDINGPTQTNIRIGYKIADGSEDSASLGGYSASVMRKIVLQFRGDVAISSIAVQDDDGEITTGNPASQTVTSSGGTTPLIVFGHYFSNGTVDPRTFSPTETGEVSSDSDLHYAKYLIYNSSPANVSVDMDDEGGVNALQSLYLEAA